MEFLVLKASDPRYKEKVRIETLEELLDFVKKQGDVTLRPPYEELAMKYPEEKEKYAWDSWKLIIMGE